VVKDQQEGLGTGRKADQVLMRQREKAGKEFGGKQKKTGGKQGGNNKGGKQWRGEVKF